MAAIIARRIRLSFSEPAATIDFYFAGILLVFAVYCLQPHWVQWRYPRMAREMAILCPIWAWGVSVAALSAAVAIAAIWRAERMLVVCYIVSFGFWMMVAWIFCIGAMVPPMEGLAAPLSGLLAVVRASQLPSEKPCG